MRRFLMPRYLSRKTLPLTLVAALCLAVPLALAWLLPWRGDHWLADRLFQQMELAEGDPIDLQARQLSALGEPGWDALLRGMQSKQPAVRDAARQALQDHVDSWRQIPADQSADQVAVLARLLVRQLPTADSDCMLAYAVLAERLLDWPAGGENGLQLVCDCEQVLRAARRSGWPRAVEAAPAPEPPVLPAPLAASLVSAERLPEPQAVPIDIHATSTESTTRPGLTAAPVEDLGVGAPKTSSLGLQTELPASPFSPQPSEGAFAEALVPSTTPVEAPESVVHDWPALGILQVIHHLRDVPSKAESELRRRGFDEINLRIARTAADSDPENRVKLVRMLPGLTGVDATGWLLLLARDESPRVRTAAVQVLATATDPRIHRQLRELAETETDVEVHAAMRKSGRINR